VAGMSMFSIKLLKQIPLHLEHKMPLAMRLGLALPLQSIEVNICFLMLLGTFLCCSSTFLLKIKMVQCLLTMDGI
jgi:hypothetical protein